MHVLSPLAPLSHRSLPLHPLASGLCLASVPLSPFGLHSAMLCSVVLLLGEVEDSSVQRKALASSLFSDGCFGAAWSSNPTNANAQPTILF